MAGRTPVGKATIPTPGQAPSLLNDVQGIAQGVKGFFNPDSTKVASDFSGFPGGNTGGSRLPPASTQAGAVAQSTAAPTSSNGASFTSDEQARISQMLLDSKSYLPNPLNDFLNVTYHIKFFVADIQAYRTNLGDSNSLDFKKAITAMDGVPKIIIAESGVTAGLNIIDLTFNQGMTGFRPQEAELNATTSDWKMTIREPVGTLFFDMLRNSLLSVGAKTITDHPFFVEISFKGYNDDGTPNDNVLTNGGSGNGGRFLHRLWLNSIQSDIDEGGSVHRLMLQNPGVFAQDDEEAANTQSMIRISATTVGEFFKQLGEAMTKAQDDRYGTDASTGHYNEFTFTIKPTDDGSDPEKWQIVTKEPEMNSQTMLSFEDGKPTFNIPPQTSLDQIVNMVFSNTEEAQKYANAVPINGETEVSKDATNADRVKDTKIMHVFRNVTETKYHPIARKYMRIYDYIIMMYSSNGRAPNSTTQLNDAKEPSAQAKMLDNMFKRGFLRKKYAYLYTGLNTEIISLQINLDLQWSGKVGNLLGYRLNGNAMSQQAKWRDIETADSAYQKVREILDELAKAQANLLAAEQQKSPDLAAQRKKVSDLQAQATAEQQKAATDRAKVFAERDKNPRSPPISPKGLVFAENLTSTPSYEDVDLDVGLTPMPGGSDYDIGKGGAGQYHRDRGLYSLMFEQIFGVQGSMQDIEMEVRGDPFWMARGNVELQAYKNKSVTDEGLGDHAKYLEGDNTFLLYVSYPSGVDDTGAPIFRAFEDGIRRDVISSIYRVNNVTNKFENGAFTQTIYASRQPLINLSLALGYSKFENPVTGETTDVGSEASDTTDGKSSQFNTDRRISNADKQHSMQVVYDSLVAKGYTPEAAKTMVAEIGRENSFNPNTMFGTHVDGADQLTNAGIISWQGDRKVALDSFMRSRGFVNPDGTYAQSDDSLRAQVDFVDHELSTNPQYSRTYNAMRNPDYSYGTLEQVIGQNYVVWDRSGSTPIMQKNNNLENAFLNQKTFYNTISDMTDKKGGGQ